ncbi:hypothetical protein FB45DRAFT_1021360 [Roridomyces roridus]|uniref:F-box domain-containing protein n=1 Tax=Roridomyces roridus TaxID=1738132 RepID=A0AAD7CBX7_9AGAR|nr:hypothetical protein FB45DRAFT_1021360 [Roridomyces roridus]
MHQPTMLAFFPSNLEIQTSIFENRTKQLIAASEATIAHLEAKISDEEAILTHLRSTIAPIRNLPPDLLSRIFLLSVSDADMYSREITARLTLTRVCARWRRVAHTTPQLWAVAAPTYYSKHPTKNYFTGLRSWMERSAPLPLPVSLHCPHDPVAAGLIMDTLCTEAHRWSYADLTLPSLLCLARIPPRSLEQLTGMSLVIRGEADSDDEVDPIEIIAFSHTPQLRDLDLNIPFPDRLPIPWSQLLGPNLHAPPSACLNILERCPALTAVVIEMEGWETLPDLLSRAMTTIVGLTTLELDLSERTGHFIPLFACLTLPELHELELKLSEDLVWDTAELSRFLLRSPKLYRLSIDNSKLDADDLLAVLRSSPSLAKLEMYSCEHCITDAVMTALRYSESDAVHLTPKLQELMLECVGDHFDPENLATTIVSRWWSDEQLAAMPSRPAVARWEKIHISVDAELDDDEDDHFTRAFWDKLSRAGCRNGGLDVRANHQNWTGYGMYQLRLWNIILD